MCQTPIAAQLPIDGEQGNRRALEMFALEDYRSGERANCD
jgi:hypothetical protein